MLYVLKCLLFVLCGACAGAFLGAVGGGMAALIAAKPRARLNRF
ncbi:hypothetical protein [Methylocella sp. CPCC 101449]|jgi:hypothetical protein|nr:hypothetical protein [Methylocella sp. CPCC 101449]MDT2020882.1 hypothetical protein [Methylocella sp. CPCC 101449]HEV2570864.1 hypothetical protein [Beijerinckiaceae bacterium]